MQLRDSVVLVTGAGRGWGRSIAFAFAREAAKVIIVSRTETEIQETAQLIKDEGGDAYAFPLIWELRKELIRLLQQFKISTKNLIY